MAEQSAKQLDLLEGAAVDHDRDDIILPGPVRAYDAFTKLLFDVSMVAMLSIMTLLIGMDVILRVFFDTPIRGTHDLVGLSLLILVLVGLPHSWRGGYHVRMDMIYGLTPKPFRRAVDVFAALAAIVFGLLLAYQAARYIPHYIRTESSSVTLKIPYWPFCVAIMVSAILFTISVVIDILMTVFGRRRSAGI